MSKEFIDILGSSYEIIRDVDLGPDKAGETDFSKKEICLTNDRSQELDMVLKHEIMHAFFYECGLMKYADDEVLVDFLAMQFDKLKHLMGAISERGQH